MEVACRNFTGFLKASEWIWDFQLFPSSKCAPAINSFSDYWMIEPRIKKMMNT